MRKKRTDPNSLPAQAEKREKDLARGGVSQALSRRDSAKKPDKRVDK